MVHAHVAANRLPAAIELCETMCYNLRRSRGVLDPVTVEMTQMLAALYTSDGRVDRCMGMHEQILREIEATLREESEWHHAKARASVCYLPVNGSANGVKTNGAATSQPKAEDLAKMAGWSLELLKRSHLRLGGWTKSEQDFVSLHARLHSSLGKAGLQVSSPDTWAKAAAANKDKPDDMIGKYVGLREWEWQLEGGEDGEDHTHNGVNGIGAGHVGSNGSSVRWSWNCGVDHVLVASHEWLA